MKKKPSKSKHSAQHRALLNLIRAVHKLSSQVHELRLENKAGRMLSHIDGQEMLAIRNTASATFHAVQQMQSEGIGDVLKTHQLLGDVLKQIAAVKPAQKPTGQIDATGQMYLPEDLVRARREITLGKPEEWEDTIGP
jgi:hypothetical protein